MVNSGLEVLAVHSTVVTACGAGDMEASRLSLKGAISQKLWVFNAVQQKSWAKIGALNPKTC